MVQETRDLIVLVARIGNGISASLEDGKVTIEDALSFGPAISALPAAIVGIKDVIVEVHNATDEEKELLVDTFAAEFSISNAKAEEAIEHTLAVIVEFWKILKAFKKD